MDELRPSCCASKSAVLGDRGLRRGAFAGRNDAPGSTLHPLASRG